MRRLPVIAAALIVVASAAFAQNDTASKKFITEAIEGNFAAFSNDAAAPVGADQIGACVGLQPHLCFDIYDNGTTRLPHIDDFLTDLLDDHRIASRPGCGGARPGAAQRLGGGCLGATGLPG